MAVADEFGLVPDPDQFILELADEVDHFQCNCFQHLQLRQAFGTPNILPAKQILVEPQVELLLQEDTRILVDEVVYLALLLEDPESLE